MAKFIPSFIPILIALAVAVAPYIQAWMGAHPMAMTLLGALYAVLTHLLPSPVAQKELGK